jgi:hypothetical protein
MFETSDLIRVYAIEYMLSALRVTGHAMIFGHVRARSSVG